MSAIKGMDSLLRKLSRLGGDVPAALLQATQKTAETAEGDAKAAAPNRKGSQADADGEGSLRQSFATEDKVSGYSVESRVFSKAKHAEYVEFGTGPVGAANHAGVSPHVNKVYTTRESWAFPIVIDGEETVRTTSGYPARPFLYPAAVKNKDTFVQNVRMSILEAIRKAGG